MTRLEFTPLIIIGAARSGTNVLRDTICRLDGFATWDCDEINPIWRHGNIGVPHDELGRTHARPAVSNFIRHAFRRMWRRAGCPQFVVEKTCANSLRVPFVDAVLPEAKFIFIVRDGADVVASAGKRWRGVMELDRLAYFWAKIRNTPLLDLPVYGWNFVRARLTMIGGAQDHLAFWGPRPRALEQLPASASLDERCAVQWAACVRQSVNALDELPPARVLRMSYESFTADPHTEICRVLDFLGVDRPKVDIKRACAPVSQGSVGKGRGKVIDPRSRAVLAPVLLSMGYAIPSDDEGTR